MPKRGLLLINVNSKNGATDIDRAVAILHSMGMALTPKPIRAAEEISRQILDHRDDVDCVILGGGDGTMNAAAPALLETGLPLGILPMGTANDLARTLKIPFDIEEAARIITGGRLHRIDLGAVNGHYFFNVANIGGGMTVANAARIDDGLCFLYSVKPSSLWDFLKSAFAFRSGQFTRHHPVDLDHGRAVEIKTSRRMVVTADGEQVTHTPARFSVRRAAIQVFIPEAYPELSTENDRVDSRQRADPVE